MNCKVCRRPLSDPKSIERGMGNICAGHTSQDIPSDETNKADFVADVFDNDVPFGKAFVMRRAGSASDADHRRLAVTNVPHLVVHHSPDGFEFGYGGSGAADLALNACQLYLNLTHYTGQKTKCYDGNCWALAWSLHQQFKRDFIAGVNWVKGAAIPFETIEAWFLDQMTGEALALHASHKTHYDE